MAEKGSFEYYRIELGRLGAMEAGWPIMFTGEEWMFIPDPHLSQIAKFIDLKGLKEAVEDGSVQEVHLKRAMMSIGFMVDDYLEYWVEDYVPY